MLQYYLVVTCILNVLGRKPNNFSKIKIRLFFEYHILIECLSTSLNYKKLLANSIRSLSLSLSFIYFIIIFYLNMFKMFLAILENCLKYFWLYRLDCSFIYMYFHVCNMVFS